MKLIDRYILRTFLVPLITVAVSFNLIFVVYDLFDNFDVFVDNGASLKSVASYYLHLLPSRAWLIMPVSLLLGVLYALYQLTRHNELTAMRASGISLYRLLTPNVLLGLLIALGVGVIDETAGPAFSKYCQEFIESTKSAKKPPKSASDVSTSTRFVNLLRLNPKSGLDWQIGSLDTRKETFFRMEDIRISKMYDGTQEYEFKLRAQSAEFRSGEWIFRDATLEKFRPGLIPEKKVVYKGDELYKPGFEDPPDLFMQSTAEWQESFMTAGEIRTRLKRAGDSMSPESRARLQTEFHSRLARPLACFIATLLGIPFGFQTARKGFFAGIVICLISFFGYYAFYIVMIALGKNGHIPPAVAGWTPNIAFTILGLGLFRRMRQ